MSSVPATFFSAPRKVAVLLQLAFQFGGADGRAVHLHGDGFAIFLLGAAGEHRRQHRHQD
ncbi:MAG: hypothetical protein IPG66_10450 [Hydrogenophilales bacterium]|nr:hypothetical protein [Hydrogenophilales bacterium]